MTARYKFGRARISDAHRLLEQASMSGDYKMYERAIAAFDLATGSEEERRAAERGKREAQLSYATTAVINRDYELASSLIEPLLGTCREADALMRRIQDKALAARISGNHRMRLLKIGLLSLAILVVVGWVNFYRYLKKVGEENPMLGNMVERVDRALSATSAASIQLEFTAFYGLLQSVPQGEFHRRYPTFLECADILNQASRLIAVSATAPGEQRDRRFRLYLLENLPVLNAFRNEIATEESLTLLRSNAQLLTHLDNLIQLLIKHGDDPEEE